MSEVIKGQPYKIAIKIPPADCRKAQTWGDYHLALCLKRALENLGCPTLVQCQSDWYNSQDSTCDAVIVLRGLRSYQTNKHHFNILWNISHPDLVSIREYNQYDYVLISSIPWSNAMKSKLNVPVEAMLQCTDPHLFKPFYREDCWHELLFVGNSRSAGRKIINDLLPTSKDLSVYGNAWSRFIDPKYIKGRYIPNDELYKYYSSCDILLNDHWHDMRSKGFINNRIFDALASEAFIISDDIIGLEDVVPNSVVVYHTRKELEELIDYYLAHPELRKKKANIGAEIVRNRHTYAKRAERFIEIIKLNGRKNP